jgi:hypothetical protein
MRVRYRILAGLTLAAAILFGIWWDHSGQTWLAIHTGTDYCVNLPPGDVTVCKAYGFWSGFGSDLGEYAVVASLVSSAVLALRHINCHEPGCWRVGRYPVAGGEFKMCHIHHPDFGGAHPSREYILSLHAAHRRMDEKLDEIHRHVTALAPQAGRFPPGDDSAQAGCPPPAPPG